jgi:hypothetical protein
MATKLLQCNSHRDYFDRWEKISARIHHDTGNHMGVAWVQSGGLTRKSRGLMETARTSTSRGFRSGTGTPCLISITSGPPKRGTTTARQVFSAAAVDAGRHPSRRRRALTALHHIALEHTELQRLRLRLASWSWRRQCRRGARGDRTRWGGGEGECEKGLRAEEDTLTQLWGRSSQRPNVS